MPPAGCSPENTQKRMDEKGKKVLASLQRLCSKQECCSSAVFDKALRKLEFDRDAAAEVLESLVADGFVDDSRYAAAFAREKAGITGWGPVKIRYALAAKGIRGTVVDDALGEIDCGSADTRLRKLLEARKASLEGDPQIRLKLIRFALSRGYEYEKVEKLLKEL